MTLCHYDVIINNTSFSYLYNNHVFFVKGNFEKKFNPEQSKVFDYPFENNNHV